MPAMDTFASAHGTRASAVNRWVLQLGAVLLGSTLLWASAKVQVPFWPVPMTMQTYVVLSVGALFGWRLGAMTILAYIAEGALGLPVFAGSPASGVGLAYLAGPTGGYLAGYVLAVVLVGLLAESGWDRSLPQTALAVLAGEMAILGMGCAWLAAQMGWQKALAFGLGPFLFGDAAKMAFATVTISYGKHMRSILRR